MRRQPVSSSNLRSVSYDPGMKVLKIEFHNGGIYRYFGVPAYAYSSLMTSASHGGYFHDHIKGIYRFVKVI